MAGTRDRTPGPDWKGLRRSWDEMQALHIPEREARFEAMTEILSVALPSRFRALDIGCGTGSLSERVLRRSPGARVVAIDHDPVLLAIGQHGLGSVRGRLAWVDADLRVPDWDRAIPRGRFDAAVSTTALHWLQPMELRGFYRGLARRLRAGAIFLNGDSLPARPGEKSRIERLARAIRHRRSRDRARADAKPWSEWWRHVSREPGLSLEWSEHERRYPHPHGNGPSSGLTLHRRALRAAGFREVGVLWQDLDNRVLVAVR